MHQNIYRTGQLKAELRQEATLGTRLAVGEPLALRTEFRQVGSGDVAAVWTLPRT